RPAALQRGTRRRHDGRDQAGGRVVPAAQDHDLGRDGGKGGGLTVPKPATVLHQEVDALRAAWARNPRDLGLGLYNPGTGEIHIGSFDETGRTGHDGLANLLGITNEAEW